MCSACEATKCSFVFVFSKDGFQRLSLVNEIHQTHAAWSDVK
jgi:hypothetical protein